MNLRKIISSIFSNTGSGSMLQAEPAKRHTIGLYQTIDRLPLWNYYKIKTENELGYLLKLEDYADMPKYDKSILEKVWLNIGNEIANYSDSTALLNYKEKTAELLNLRNKFNILSDCLIILSLNDSPEALEIVKKYFPKVETPQQLQQQLIGLKKKIEMKYADYKEKYEVKSEKEPDIYEVLDKIGQMKQTILDPFKITVKQYLVMIKSFNNGGR